MAIVSPNLVVDAVLAYQQTAAIKAAVELDLFSEIAKGTNTAEGLCEANRSGGARHPHSLRLPYDPRSP